MNSDKAKKGYMRSPHRSLLKAAGYTDWEIERPWIGIANAYNAVIPGHVHLRNITEAVKAGMKEEQVCPVAHASQSRVAYFHVFMQGTGKKRHWENVDFEALTEKFDKAAEKGKRAKMQPKARLDAKKTCVDEAMRVMREQTDNSGDKAKCARITDISHNFSMRPKDESLTHDGENTNR